MRENIIRITTHDTRKTYEFPMKTGNNPYLWEVELRIGFVKANGRTLYGLSRNTSIFLEESTLKQHGLIGKAIGKQRNKIEPSKNPEDLILELLELVGVYPMEENE